MKQSASRRAFTLRFRDESTHRALRQAADELGLSMNELVERAIEHELAIVGAELEEKLRRTVRLLGRYRADGAHGADDRMADARDFARAEVEEDDPLRSRAAEPFDDPVGVGAVFADPVER